MQDVIISRPDEAELDRLGVRDWPIWQKEISIFPWHYDATEICYLLEGEVEVTANGNSYHFGAGDLVTFAKNLDCEWNILRDVRKHYSFS